MNQRLYIDVGGFVWEVISPFDISSSAKNSRCENKLYQDFQLIKMGNLLLHLALLAHFPIQLKTGEKTIEMLVLGLSIWLSVT